MKQRPDHRQWPPRILVCLCVVVGAGESAAAATPASQPPRALLIAGTASARVSSMLRSELTALGVEVVQPDQPAGADPPPDLAAAARRLNTVAVFRVLPGDAGVEVWIADRATGQLLLRERLAQGAGSAVENSVVVLRAIELLRASLAETDAPAAARAAAPTPVRIEPVPRAPDRSERFSLAVQPAAFFSPGGAGGSVGLLAAVGWRASRWLDVRLRGGATVTPAEVVAPEGTVAVQSRWLGVELALATSPTAGRWRHRAGVGGALIAINLRGHAAPSSPANTIASEDTMLSPALMASAGTSYALSRNLRVCATIWAAAPWRSPTIVIAGRDVASYGALILAGGIGLEIMWPGRP